MEQSKAQRMALCLQPTHAGMPQSEAARDGDQLQSRAAPPQSDGGTGALQPHELHVLLVDDEQLSRLVVGNLLRKCNYKGTLCYQRLLSALPSGSSLLLIPSAAGLALCVHSDGSGERLPGLGHTATLGAWYFPTHLDGEPLCGMAPCCMWGCLASQQSHWCAELAVPHTCCRML